MISWPLKEVIAKIWEVLELFQAILIRGSVWSYIILLSVKFLVSKSLAVQSAPTVAKLLPSGPNEISNTSLSWVITNLDKLYYSISHKEQVVSILEQHIIFLLTLFQSKLVIGEASSFYYLLIREHLWV